jgi:hypothetical protein
MGLRHGLFAGFNRGLRQCPDAAAVFAVSLAPETIDVTAGGTGNITNEGGSSPDLGPAHEGGGPGVRSCSCA